MRIVLVGAGEVGYNVAKDLSSDGHDIVVVEEDDDRAERAESTLDVMVIRGNAARPSVLSAAGIRADGTDVQMLIACSNKDEVNLMACWIAKRMGVPHVISRAVGLEFTDNESWARDLGIDMLISPERSVAREIEELLEIRAALHANEIAGGRAGIYVFRVASDSPLKNLSLIDVRKRNSKLIMLVVCVKRGEESFIPRATENLLEGDVCYTMCYRSMVFDIEKLFQPSKTKRLKRVFIVGGGKVGSQTAARLISHIRGVEVRLIDKDRAKCERLARAVPKAMVLCADAADKDFLLSEGIADADGFVAATDQDETNLMLAVSAKTLGAAKSISVVRTDNYLDMTNHIPVDAIVNRNKTLADVITRNVRYPGSSRALTSLEEIDAEAVEITISKSCPAAGKSLMELSLPPGAIVGFLEHRNEMLIPTGGTVLYGGDKIVLFGAADVMETAMTPFTEDNKS